MAGTPSDMHVRKAMRVHFAVYRAQAWPSTPPGLALRSFVLCACVHVLVTAVNGGAFDNVTCKQHTSLSFIHIGKCGGTTVRTWLDGIRNSGLKFRHIHLSKMHLRHSHLQGDADRVAKQAATHERKFIIWLRDPLERFRSAYEYQHAIVTADTSKFTLTPGVDYRASLAAKVVPGNSHRLVTRICELGPGCLDPYYLTKKRVLGFAYSTLFDKLNEKFPTANDLAEGLSSEHESTRRTAQALMSSSYEHVAKNVAWYLSGAEVKNTHSANSPLPVSLPNWLKSGSLTWLEANAREGNIFVGLLENQHESMSRLNHFVHGICGGVEVWPMQLIEAPHGRKNVASKQKQKPFSENATRNLKVP